MTTLTLDTTAAHAALAALRVPHAYGHTCDDGRWYNQHVGTRTPCPAWGHATLLDQQLDRLRTVVHDSAHDDRVMRHVAVALYAGPFPEGIAEWEAADQETRDGYLTMARWATEGLAAVLDPDSRPELQEHDPEAAARRELEDIPVEVRTRRFEA